MDTCKNLLPLKSGSYGLCQGEIVPVISHEGYRTVVDFVCLRCGQTENFEPLVLEDITAVPEGHLVQYRTV